MHGEILLVVLILTIGCAAFFFSMVYVLGRVIAFLVRGFVGLFRPRFAAGRRRFAPGGGPVRVCPREQCRKIEGRPARFCGQCGARLSEAPDYVPF